MSANFDSIAKAYRWLEYAALGRTLERTREEFLPRLDECRQALVLGDGDGRFTAKLMRRNAQVRVLAVDLSGAMLRLLGGRCEKYTADRLKTACTDAREVTVDADTDLVVTHFFLDCLTQAEAEGLTHQVAARLHPGALWVVSEFRVPHWPARMYVRGLYLAFRLLTGLRVTRLPDYAGPMRRAGFVLEAERLRMFGMLTSQIWRKVGGDSA